MPSTFTPSDAIDMSKEREWSANLGMLDWDSTNIVFTKRSLIEFLKYTGTTVDTNFANISKLPKYATFGKISESKDATTTTQAQATARESSTGTAAVTSAGTAFKPTRRVRDVPGGAHSDIFGHDEDDALANAPPRPGQEAPPAPPPQPERRQEPEERDESGIQFSSNPIPSRRVREQPGGKDSLASLWGNDDEPASTAFKPTRRVRDAPGGRDNISGIF